MDWALKLRAAPCRRRNMRIDVQPSIEVTLSSDEGEFRGRLHDISLGGARISSPDLPSRTGSLRVTHGDSDAIPAEVRWREGGMRGLAFADSTPAVTLLTRCLRRLIPYERLRTGEDMGALGSGAAQS